MEKLPSPPPPPLSPFTLDSSTFPRFFVHDDPHHFLDSCFLCSKPLSRNRDIFMYRGDVPFCSEECRQEQIDMDEAMERKWNGTLGSKRKPKAKSTAEVVLVEAAGAVAAG